MANLRHRLPLALGIGILVVVLLVAPLAGTITDRGNPSGAATTLSSTAPRAVAPDHSLGAPRALGDVRPASSSVAATDSRIDPIQPMAGTLADAVASLQAGHGPAGLPPVECSLRSAQSGVCSSPPSMPRTAGLDSLYGFQNTTTFGYNPPQLVGASLAWDGGLGAVVLFGGEMTRTDAYTNQTWIYYGQGWENFTQPTAPPARAWAAMSFDANVDGLLLVGGCGVVCPLSDTWIESDGYWTNVTADASALTLGGSGLWDAVLTANGTNGVVIFGGCWDSACSQENRNTLFYSVYDGVCLVSGEACWWYYPSMSTPPARFDTTFVADPETGLDYLYGGYSYAGGTGGTNGFNDTWAYNPSNYTWVDITYQTGAPYGEYPAGATFGMTLFYDPYSEDMILYGGENASGFFLTDDLWVLDGVGWFIPIPLAVPAWPMTFANVASPPYGEDLPPVLWGGTNSSLVTSTNSTWVWEEPLFTNDNAVPTTVETNATVELYSNTTGGGCDDFYFAACYGVWELGDGGVYFGPNGTATYSVAGTYTLGFIGLDSFGVSNWSTTEITVTSYGVTASATPTSAPPGTPVTFSATVIGGMSPYNYTWNFSDGSTAFGASATHSFTGVGTQWGNLTVRDATGTEVNRSVSVTVLGPLTGSATAAPSAGVDVGHPIAFSAAASGGLGPYNYTWSVGGATGYGAGYVFTPTTVGTLTATVTIADAAATTITKTVSVPVNAALGASPSANPSAPAVNSTVTFSAGLSGGTGPYTYGWQFGDGHSSAAAAPTHTYASTGTFTAQLWVNDSGGGSVHETLTVSVSQHGGGSSSGSSSGWPVWVWGVVALVVVLAIVGALLALRRKKGSGGASSPPPPPPGGTVPPPPPPPGATGGPPPGAT